jgi:NADH-quinone oxidoreductase subunit M
LLFFGVASLGMPGLGNFIGEFLVLFGSYPEQPLVTMAATAGIVLAAVYGLTMIQQTVHGPQGEPDRRVQDLGLALQSSLVAMALVSIWLGLYPQPLLTTVSSAFGIEPPAVVSLHEADR